MGVAINNFPSKYDVAFEGQLAKNQVGNIPSGINEGETDILFGRFVAFSGEYSGVSNIVDESSKIAGVALRNVAMENNANNTPSYRGRVAGEIPSTVSYVNDQPVYVKTIGGATRGQTVHVYVKTAGGQELGTVTNTKDDNNIPVNAYFMADAEAEGLVMIDFGKLLSDTE